MPHDESRWIRDVREFHEIAAVPLRPSPGLPTEAERQLAESLITEEYVELLAASQQYDLVATADGIVDLLVVTIRYALVLGLPLDSLWAEVHRSNMSKFDQPDGGRYARFREDGKVLKPPNFSKPKLALIIQESINHAL